MNGFWRPIFQKDTCLSRRPRRGLELLLLIAVFASGLLVDGCGGKKAVRFDVVSTASTNQDDMGPLPVVVRLYQLIGKERFEKASFASLWKNDREVLDNDMVDRKEITVFPDTQTKVEWEVDRPRGVQYLGVMAAFRRPDGDRWRDITPVKGGMPFTTPSVKIVVDKQTVKIEKD